MSIIYKVLLNDTTWPELGYKILFANSFVFRNQSKILPGKKCFKL